MVVRRRHELSAGVGHDQKLMNHCCTVILRLIEMMYYRTYICLHYVHGSEKLLFRLSYRSLYPNGGATLRYIRYVEVEGSWVFTIGKYINRKFTIYIKSSKSPGVACLVCASSVTLRQMSVESDGLYVYENKKALSVPSTLVKSVSIPYLLQKTILRAISWGMFVLKTSLQYSVGTKTLIILTGRVALSSARRSFSRARRSELVSEAVPGIFELRPIDERH